MPDPATAGTSWSALSDLGPIGVLMFFIYVTVYQVLPMMIAHHKEVLGLMADSFKQTLSSVQAIYEDRVRHITACPFSPEVDEKEIKNE